MMLWMMDYINRADLNMLCVCTSDKKRGVSLLIPLTALLALLGPSDYTIKITQLNPKHTHTHTDSGMVCVKPKQKYGMCVDMCVQAYVPCVLVMASFQWQEVSFGSEGLIHTNTCTHT